MANVNPPLKNQAYAFDIGLRDFSTPGALKANPTLAAGDFLLYIDGVLSTLGAGGTGNLINLPTKIGATAVVVVTLTAAEFNGDKITVTAIDQTSPMEWEQALFTFNTTGSSSAPSAATIAAAVWDEDATGHQTTGTFGQAIGDPVASTETLYKAIVTDPAGTNIAADVIAIQADTDNIQTRLPTSLVGGRMDSSTGAMAASVITASATATDFSTEMVTTLLSTVSSGTAQGPGLGSDTIQLASGGVTGDDQYNGYIIALVAGAGAGQQRVVLDSINTGDYIQVVGGNWATAPDSTTVYILFAN